MAGFILILSELVIVLHKSEPTTRPEADLKDEIVESVIPKPITKVFLRIDSFNLIVIF